MQYGTRSCHLQELIALTEQAADCKQIHISHHPAPMQEKRRRTEAAGDLTPFHTGKVLLAALPQEGLIFGDDAEHHPSTKPKE